MTGDPFNLARFRQAQEGVIERAIAELKSGAKRSHWMWFVFPQLAGLGHSEMARLYAISGLAEAEAYLADPLLRDRLETATTAMLANAGRPALSVLGSPDDLKFHASMTLFDRAFSGQGPYAEALRLFFQGQRHAQTISSLLDQAGQRA